RIDDDAVRARFGLGDLQRLVRDELLAEAATLTAEDVWETFSDADLAGAVGMGLRQLDRRVRERIIARVEAEVGPDVLRQAVDELLRDQGARDGLWRRVRDALRAVQSFDLHPAERAALWQRADRIEELIAELPARYQDRVYRVLVRAGITSVAQLAAL